jgi:PKHD-type hydroxylase
VIGRLVVSFPPGGGGLSARQVDSLLRVMDESKMAPGRVGPGAPGRNIVPSVRRGSVQWLGVDEVGERIFSHLYSLAVVANRERGWKFHLNGITPALQATRYDGAGLEHYSWHMDWGPGPTKERKIGVVAHLSSEDSYSGGMLQLTNGSSPVNAIQAPGTVTVFPSFLMHRVTPVTSGVRLGVVAWVLGPSFR